MTLLTADEFLAQGETEENMELIEGEIVVMNTPRNRHQAIVGYLYVELALWVRSAPGHGYVNLELDHRLDDHNVFAPDLWWVRNERRPDRDAAFIVGPPDIAVEVRSDSTWRYDNGTKRSVYERNALPELWLIDTAADCVLVYRRSFETATEFDVELELVRGEAVTSPQLGDFTVDVSTLFNR